MKKIRIAVLLCVLILAVSAVSAASAKELTRKPVVSNGSIEWDQNRVIQNGETVSLVNFSQDWAYFEETADGLHYYDDILFDCDGPVKGKTSAKWIRITEHKRGFFLDLDQNTTRKTRTGTITVTGENYKAILKIRQLGSGKIASAIRKANKVTLKLKPSDAEYRFLYIYAFKENEDGSSTSRLILNDYFFQKKSYTFTVRKGWEYVVYYGNTLISMGEGLWESNTDWLTFTVNSVKGSETLR